MEAKQSWSIHMRVYTTLKVYKTGILNCLHSRLLSCVDFLSQYDIKTDFHAEFQLKDLICVSIYPKQCRLDA